MQFNGAPAVFECPQCPNDSISSISWYDETVHNNPLLAAGTWAGDVCLWEVLLDFDSKVNNYIRIDTNNILVHKIISINRLVQLKLTSPVTAVQMAPDQSVIAGCNDGSIYAIQRCGGSPIPVYKHDAPIVKLLCIFKQSILISVSIDKTMKFYNMQTRQIVHSIELSSIPCDAALNNEYIVVLCEDANSYAYKIQDLKSNPTIISSNEFSFPVTKIALHPQNTSCVVGSLEGRGRCFCLANRFQPFYFRAHRLTDTGIFATSMTSTDKTICYPINAIDFFQHKNIFASGGGDGYVTTWNINTRQKIDTFNIACGPVTDVKFGNAHALLAYAIGDDWALGFNGNHNVNSKLCVIALTDSICNGKKK